MSIHYRVPLFLKTSMQYNAVLLRGEVVAFKSIKPGQPITLKPKPITKFKRSESLWRESEKIEAKKVEKKKCKNAL